jgi:hypothetical protein
VRVRPYEFVRDLIAPDANGPIELTFCPTALIPAVLGGLETRASRYVWATPDDWKRGRRLIREVQAGLLMGTAQELIESNNRIYRLLSTALLGTEYTVTPAVSPLPALPADPTRPTITPALPDAPPATAPALLPGRAMLNRQQRLLDVVDNALNGTVVDAAPTLQPSVRDNLEAMRQLLATADSLDGDMLAQLISIAFALA